MSKIQRMQVFYIVFEYDHGQLEMIDGPYGTFDEALAEMNSTYNKGCVIVQQTLEVLNVHRPTD
jgi:hypothetical protein